MYTVTGVASNREGRERRVFTCSLDLSSKVCILSLV